MSTSYRDDMPTKAIWRKREEREDCEPWAGCGMPGNTTLEWSVSDGGREDAHQQEGWIDDDDAHTCGSRFMNSTEMIPSWRR